MALVFSFAGRMLLPMAISTLAVALWRLAATRRLRQRGLQTTLWHEVGIGLFAAFLAGLAWLAIVPAFSWTAQGLRFPGLLPGDVWQSINLIPGQVLWDTYQATFVEGDSSALLINFVGNIIMFMPIGFAPPLLWAICDNRKKVLLLGLCASLCIEVSQLPQARMTDVDDLWLNTLGCYMGWLLYSGCRKRFGVMKRWRVRHMATGSTPRG